MSANDPTIINKFVSSPQNVTISTFDLYTISKQEVTNAVRVANSSGILSSITVHINGTGVIDDQLCAMVFSEDPTNSTTATGNLINIVTADLPKLIGVINIPNPRKHAATMTTYTQTMISLPISSKTTSIWIVVYRNGSNAWAVGTNVTLIATTVWS